MLPQKTRMRNERGVPVDWLGYCYYLPLIATFQQVLAGICDEWLQKGQGFRCETNDVRIILSENQTDSDTSLDFWSQLAGVVVKKSPYHFVPISSSVPGAGGMIILTVYTSEEKGYSGISKWITTIELTTPCLCGIHFYFPLSILHQTFNFFSLWGCIILITAQN